LASITPDIGVWKRLLCSVRPTNLSIGIKIQSGWKYTGSFYARSEGYTGSVTVSLVSSSGTVYATKTLSGVTTSWKKFTFDFTPSKTASNVNNVFRVTVDGARASGKSIYFGMFSLFPPTYKGRQNGMRIDLAESLAGIKPGVWRFPGGNNLEGRYIYKCTIIIINTQRILGQTVATRWKWNETVSNCRFKVVHRRLTINFRLGRE
jgi:alpha-N-arabinofuranosidase